MVVVVVVVAAAGAVVLSCAEAAGPVKLSSKILQRSTDSVALPAAAVAKRSRRLNMFPPECKWSKYRYFEISKFSSGSGVREVQKPGPGTLSAAPCGHHYVLPSLSCGTGGKEKKREEKM